MAACNFLFFPLQNWLKFSLKSTTLFSLRVALYKSLRLACPKPYCELSLMKLTNTLPEAFEESLFTTLITFLVRFVMEESYYCWPPGIALDLCPYKLVLRKVCHFLFKRVFNYKFRFKV